MVVLKNIMSNLFILTGLPGSGKTTFAKNVLSEHPEIIYLSSDRIRHAFTNYRDNHEKIFSIMNLATLWNLRCNHNVIYDSTNLERRFRIQLYQKAKELKTDTKVFNIFIHPGLEKSILQSEQRKNREDVTPQLIRDMYKTMQIPSLGEDCDCIIVPINEKNKIIDFTDNITFQNYIQSIDRNLLTKTCKGDEYCI